jgi:hypothetical protein
MQVSNPWDVIFDAGEGRVVLGVDFPATRRAEAGFPDLAARIGPSYSLLLSNPPPARSSQRAHGAAYVAPWIEGIRQDGRQVAAVLGCCVGSVYAAEIVEGISQWQQAPEVILFNPQLPSNVHISLALHREISALSSLLSDDELERTRKLATEICQSVACDITDLAVEAAEAYWEVSSVAYERVGLGDSCDDKFIAPFDSYISWLAVAAQIDPCPVWENSTAVVSSDYALLPGGACRGDDGDYLIGRSIPFEVPHIDLLRSDSVASAVLGLLASR